MPEAVRLGIIGAGGIARTYHVPALRDLPDARVTAVCSRTPEDAAGLAGVAGAAWAGTSAAELLARHDVLYQRAEMAGGGLE